MTSVTDAPENPLPFARSRHRRVAGNRVIRWLRANLFSSIPSTIISLLLILVLAKACVSLLQWGFWNAIWSIPGNDTNACRAIRGLGACWAVVPEKFRFILFGTYPFDQQWRPAVATLVFIALFFLSSRPGFWRKELVLVWAAALVVIGLLMWGGVPGLPFVSQDRWGGLPVTLILATFGLAFGFPLGVLVALGRRSKLPAIRSLCVLYAGAYLAEVIRGGLQAVPRGQHEAADALGLSYWQKNGLIILPQAIRHVIPPLVNTFIAFFKDTSLVLIIGIFDLLTTAKTAIIDPAWQSFSVEVYLFVGLIYFAFCFAMSRYSRRLEAQAGST